MPTPLNILYLHSHDTGRYIQPYGHAVPTPNLQRLAEQGMLFRQAFCAAPTCSPSRAALLTGQCAHSAGMTGLTHRGYAMKDYRQHLAQVLKANGYFTALCGHQHEAHSDLWPFRFVDDPLDPKYDTPVEGDAIGYDRILPLRKPQGGFHNAAYCVTEAAERFLAQKHDKPFLLSVGYFQTHREEGLFRSPVTVEDERYCLPPAPLPDVPAIREDMAAFKASARVMDENMGRVLAALDAAGLADNTLVICTTDHGIAFPFTKCNLTDHGIGVMLIVRGPGGFAGGKVCDAMVSHIDVFPTICELAGIAAPAWLQGKSMVPLARGEAQQTNVEIFAEVNDHAAYEPMRAVRTPRWKYIRRYQNTSPLANCDDSPSKTYMLAHDLADRPVEMESLFDLIFDPNETRNLAADATHTATLADMRTRLDNWMHLTDDPLLKGPSAPSRRSQSKA